MLRSREVSERDDTENGPEFKYCNVQLDPSAATWRESDARVCLSFAANKNADDLVIVGSAHQRNLDILYDIQEGKVKFGAGSC